MQDNPTSREYREVALHLTTEQQTEELQQLYDYAPCGYHSLDKEGVFIRINQTELTMLGYTWDEIIGKKKFSDLLTPDSQQVFQENFPRFKERGWVNDLEFKIIRKDGSLLPVSVSATAIRDVAGEFLMSRSIMIDISDRKQVEGQLQLTQERLRYLLTANPAILYACQATGNYAATFVSENVLHMLGYENCEFLENPNFWADHIHPDDRSRVFADLDHLFEEGWHIHEYRFLHQDGSYRWVRDECKLICNVAGEPLELVGYWIDVTNQYFAKQEQQNSEQIIREQADLLNIATDAIFVHDLDYHIVFWNRGAQELYGWQIAEAISMDSRQILCQESLPQFEEALQIVLNTGQWQGELQKVTKTGKLLTVMSRRSLMRNQEGHPKSILTVDTDITEKKQLEAQFLRAQRLESLGTLASGIAHDLNNVLTPILGIVQLLPMKLPEMDEQMQRLLNILNESTRRGADLVKQILSFTRGIEGKPTITHINHLFPEIQKIVRQAFPKNIELSVDLPRNLWAICADITQLHQVFMNLCVNARDAMPDGGTLSITAENLTLDEHYARMNLEAKAGVYVVVTIADTGIGIPAEIVDRIFDPFFTTKEIGKGTGLGLSTVIGIIKSHGGFINVYSEVGKGTCFKVYLPAAQGMATELLQDLAPLLGNDELILIVDDEVSVQEITRATLEAHQYRAMTASDGIEAIAFYAEHKHEIRVILLDLMMPSLDSITTIRTLHKLNPHVKIIAMSGLARNETISKTMDIDIQGFLAKPFTAEELLSLLSTLCQDS